MNAQFYSNQPLVSTYSIVAYDPETGDMGVAVQSHWFSVGSIVTWGEAGVGVIATQSLANPDFGPQGLALLRTGLSAEEVLDALIKSDEGRDVRQLAVVDAKGGAASYTGKKCIQAAGHHVGKNYAVQANLMEQETVWPAMAKAYEQSKGSLAERLVTALEAAQAEGGDIRGKQSAAILVVKAKSTGKVWQDRLVDLRVEEHPTPVQELQRLLKIHQAYGFMNAGDVAIEKEDFESATELYEKAEALFPENEEMKFWHAVTLVNIGKTEDALPLFKAVFLKNDKWRTLVPRLIPSGMLTADEKIVQRILGIR